MGFLDLVRTNLDLISVVGKALGTAGAGVAAVVGMRMFAINRRRAIADAKKTEAEAHEIDNRAEVGLFAPVVSAYRELHSSLEARLKSVEAQAQTAISQERECQRQLADLRERLDKVESKQQQRLAAEGAM